MGVGRILSRGVRGDFSNFFQGGGKGSEICFSHSKLRKQPFYANNFKIQAGQGHPLPPLPTTMEVTVP